MGIKRSKILMEAGDVDGARQELLKLVDIDPSSEGGVAATGRDWL